jgi:hypothetical protein
MSARFCPICGGTHDPRAGCADRAESALREAGIKPQRSSTKPLQTKIKEADRLMIYCALAVLAVILLGIVLGLLGLGPN